MLKFGVKKFSKTTKNSKLNIKTNENLEKEKHLKHVSGVEVVRENMDQCLEHPSLG